MRVYWDTPKEINVGIGRQLVALAPGQPWEMGDEEALARIAQGDCSAFDPKEYARALKKAQDAQGGPADGDQGSEPAGAPAAVSGQRRPRTKAAGDPGDSA